jgi:hypothetical protein
MSTTDGVRISGDVRRLLWLTGADHAASPCDSLEHALNAMDPCPVNDHTSTPPDREKVQGYMDRLNQSVAFFDIFGWDLEDQGNEIAVPAELVPILRHWLERTRDELHDHSNILVRRVEAGAIEIGDWLPEGHHKRDIEDMLVERSYHLWNLLGEFGIEPPLTPRPEPLEVVA